MANNYSTSVTQPLSQQNSPQDLGYDRGYISSAVTTNTNAISARNLGYQTANDPQRYESTKI